MHTKQYRRHPSFVRKLLTGLVGGMLLACSHAGSASAAPQLLVLLDGGGRLPLQCAEGRCAVELATMCLQLERRMPEAGRSYRPLDLGALILSGRNTAGQAVHRPIPKTARIRALRSHLSVRLEIARTWLEQTFAARPDVIVAAGAVLRPLALASDAEPLAQGEIRQVKAHAKTVAQDAFAAEPKAVLTARISNYIINALPAGDKASNKVLATAWKKAVSEIAGGSDNDLSTARFIVDYCQYSANNGLAGSLHSCLQGRQDRALEDVHHGYVNALATGS